MDRAPIVLTLVVLLLAQSAATARADAIGIPDCPPGGTGVPNPHHGTGWCTVAPCTTDADCPTLPAFFGGTSGPRVCRSLGVCVWGDRQDAIGACEVDGAPCSAPGYEPGGATCHVRSYCVEAGRAPAPTPPPASVAPPAPPGSVAPPESVAPPASDAPPASSSGRCSAAAARAHAAAWPLALLGVGVIVLAARRPRRRAR